jgi:ABC-2 type transport system permease protein
MSDIAVPLPAVLDLPNRRSAIGDALTMAARCIRLSARNLDALLTALMLPVMLLLVLVYLFGGAIRTGTEYLTYVVPGVILLCAAFGSATTAVTVSHDMTGGIIDRFRSMDVGGPAILAGHVAASVVRNAASTVLVFVVAFMIGFRPSATPLDWLAVAVVLLAFVIAISWLSAGIGLLTKSPEAANGFGFFVLFSTYASSAFVPVHTMPSWVQGVAQHQPVTPVVETLRGLLLGTALGSSAVTALIWCSGILAASIAVSGMLFQRRTA